MLFLRDECAVIRDTSKVIAYARPCHVRSTRTAHVFRIVLAHAHTSAHARVAPPPFGHVKTPANAIWPPRDDREKKGSSCPFLRLQKEKKNGRNPSIYPINYREISWRSLFAAWRKRGVFRDTPFLIELWFSSQKGTRF